MSLVLTIGYESSVLSIKVFSQAQAIGSGPVREDYGTGETRSYFGLALFVFMQGVHQRVHMTGAYTHTQARIKANIDPAISF